MKNNHPLPSPGSDGIRRRIVNDTLKHFKAKHAPKPVHEVVERAKLLSLEVHRVTKEVLKQSQAAGHPYNEKAMQALVSKLYLDGFSKWSKDELVFLVTLIHGEIAMAGINEAVNMGLEGGQNPDKI